MPVISRQRLLELVQDREGPLCGLYRLMRMHVREAREAGDVLVHFRVVLHRARPERVEAGVDAVVQPAEPDEVADDLVLRHLREVEVAPQEAVGQRLASGTSRAGRMTPVRPGRLRSNVRRAPMSAVLGSVRGRAAVVTLPTSLSPSASRSISSRVFISVTQINMPFVDLVRDVESADDFALQQRAG